MLIGQVVGSVVATQKDERLGALKRLRADGAITEEEYQREYSKALSEL